jgi:hypothetical protein
MSILSDANVYSKAGVMINGKELSPYQVQKRKYMYLEGLIRFLELYGNNEIGNVEVDIEKCSLYINSAYFENTDLYSLNKIEDVFKMLEKDLYNNVPLYRFLRLSNYQLRLFEKEHHTELLKDYEADANKYPCLKCIWYESTVSSFGTTSKCTLPKEKLFNKYVSTRQGFMDITKRTKCRYVTTLNDVENFKTKYFNNVKFFYVDEVNRIMERGIKRLKTKIDTMDNCLIPPIIPEEDKLDLQKIYSENKFDNACKDFARAFGNKLPFSTMAENYQKAVLLECMIKFVEIYAQTELGSDYFANISKIARWIDKQHNLKFTSEDDIYKWIENLVIDGLSINNFCTRKYV